MTSKNDKAVAKASVADKIFEHSRDYLNAKFKIPLGDPILKKVHTNQYMFTELPEEFSAANWNLIAHALSSNYNRFSGATYVTNRWYIEDITIDVDATNNKAEMDIGVNAMASSLAKYSSDFRAFEKAYNDTVKNKNNNNKTSASKSTSNATTTKNTTIKNGWWGTWVTQLVQKVVGNEKSVLERCKKIHEYWRWRKKWTNYNNMKYTQGDVKLLEKNWNRDEFNCGDGANYLSAFYSACGAKTGIYLTPGHFVVKCVIGDKVYWCDHSGAEGAYNTLRGFGQTYQGLTGGRNMGRYV